MADQPSNDENHPFPLQLRILCLHDEGSNAPHLKACLDRLGKRLYEKHEVDLVYVNSPLTMTTLDEGEEGDRSRRSWWEEGVRESIESSSSSGKVGSDGPAGAEVGGSRKVYTGLDASLLLLRQVWNSCPMQGILGVGRGASVGSLLSLMMLAEQDHDRHEREQQEQEGERPSSSSSFIQSPLPQPPPQFAIFVRGESLLPEEERLSENLPCLHVVSESRRGAGASASSSIPSRTDQHENGSERLIRQFGGQVHISSSPISASDSTSSESAEKFFANDELNVMGKFIVEQKKRILSWNKADGGGEGGRGEIVALQTALHYAELEAADRIAEEIASDPPASLMAVIRPQAVAGWCGNKRRQPGEQGGGAPCPSEFLLRREKRSGKKDGGPTRVHPTSREADSKNGEENENQTPRGQQETDSDVADES